LPQADGGISKREKKKRFCLCQGRKERVIAKLKKKGRKGSLLLRDGGIDEVRLRGKEEKEGF